MRVLIALFILALSAVASATDIELTWTAPTQDIKGNALSEIDGYKLYYSVNNVVQPVIDISPAMNVHVLNDVVNGSHTFQISTISNGLESDLSSPVNVDTEAGKPVRIELTVRVVD